MKFDSFIYAIISNILRIQYLIKNTYIDHLSLLSSSQSTAANNVLNDTKVSLDWILDHMGTRGNYPNYLLNDTKVDPVTLEYTIDQIQFVIRHGTRYPVINGINAIKEALLKLNESNNHHLIGWIKDYRNEYHERRTGQLSQKGQTEEYIIGKRLSTKYPEFISNLIDGDIVSTQFQAFTSWSGRTSQSGQAFCIGLFEGLGELGPTGIMSVPILTLPKNNESLIAMEKACPRWQLYTKKKVSELIQPLLDTYLKPIAERLSIELELDTTPKDVSNFYDACTTEISMHEQVETFCKLFERQDIIKLEYIDDLNHYYKHSYGLMDLNKYMACDLGKFILDGIENQEKFKLDIKFGHSETTLPLRTFLGLYKDDPLLSVNSTIIKEDRLFKMSNFGYFANNIAFQVVSHKSSKEQFVRVLDNEIPISLPGCKDILCPIDEFKLYLNSRINECDFIEFCKL